MDTFRKLPSSFSSKAFHHELVQRTATAALYRRTRNGISHFEVIRVRTAKLHLCYENRDGIDATMIYPSSAE